MGPLTHRLQGIWSLSRPRHELLLNLWRLMWPSHGQTKRQAIHKNKAILPVLYFLLYRGTHTVLCWHQQVPYLGGQDHKWSVFGCNYRGACLHSQDKLDEVKNYFDFARDGLQTAGSYGGARV